MNKANLRRRCRGIRESMPRKQVQSRSRALCDHLDAWPVFQQTHTVLSYIAFRNEPDLDQLFQRWPHKRWLTPRVVESRGQRPYLILHLYDPAQLVRHPFGMLEPSPDQPIIDPEQVEMILTPGVAFDRQGGRLGFGGGFYDRLLPQASQGLRVGITYDELVLDAVPMQPWDCRVEWLATPSKVLKTEHSTSGE